MAAEELAIRAPNSRELPLSALRTSTATDFDGTDDRITTEYATRRNFVPNPRCANDAANYSVWYGTCSLSRATGLSLSSGTTALKATQLKNEAYTGFMPAYTPTAGDKIAGRMKVKIDNAGLEGAWTVQFGDAGGNWLGPTTAFTMSSTGFTEITWAATVGAGHSGNVVVRLNSSVGAISISDEILYADVLIERADTAGTFFDGSGYIDDFGNWISDPGGHVGWTGAAHASASDKGCFASGTDRTLSGWFFRDSSATNDVFFSAVDPAGNARAWLLASGGSGDVSFSFLNSVTGTWSGGIASGVWTHLTLTIDWSASQMTLYNNGASFGPRSFGAAVFEGKALGLQLGVRGTSSNPFDGKMAGFAVFERALSGGEIADIYSAANLDRTILALTPAIYLPLDADNGTTDLSGNGRNGTGAGGITIGTHSPGPTTFPWSLEEIDLGTPPRREELVSSADSNGGVPARVSMRDTREVNLRLRLVDATDKDSALSFISALETILESAEGFAAAGPTDPVAGLVRLTYAPADSSYSFSLLVLTGSIEVPKTMDSADFGWTINFPVVNIKCICDPFAYGALRTYLDTTTTAEVAPSVTVAGGPGDVSPWTRLAIKDVASTSRGRVVLGVKQGEATTTATILASAMTAVAGTYSAPNLTMTSTSWAVVGSTARQTRTGNFRIYAHRSSTSATGSLRLAWSEAGGSLRRATAVELGELGDTYLGEVSADSAWDMWIEGYGTTSFYALIIEPVDSHIEVTQASPGEQMVGTVVAEDALQTTSTHIGGRSMTTGGTWSTVNASSPSWPVSSSTWARRLAVSMGSAAFALAGTANFISHQVRATLRISAANATAGIHARYINSSNFLLLAVNTDSITSFRPNLWAFIGGSSTGLWSGSDLPISTSYEYRLTLQVIDDGRWFADVTTFTSSGSLLANEQAVGDSPLLIEGGTLGNTSAAQAGLYDYSNTGVACTRDWKDFSVASLTGITPPPIPSGDTLTLAGPSLYNSDDAEYTYIGGSGLDLKPGVNNNLTVMAQRSAVGHASTSTADTPALDLDIDGYPRFLTVPHS